MSIEQFICTWKATSYDTVTCQSRDAYGNPLEVWFYRKGKVILKLYIIYDANGEWQSITTVQPKQEQKPKEKSAYK